MRHFGMISTSVARCCSGDRGRIVLLIYPVGWEGATIRRHISRKEALRLSDDLRKKARSRR